MEINAASALITHVPDFIYDVGMHNGDDTAYYLFKGFLGIGEWFDIHVTR